MRKRGHPVRRYSLTATVWCEDNQYVSKCPELGVASCGKSPDKALDALREAVELYLGNAKALGILPALRATLNAKHRFTAPLEVSLP